MSGDTARTCRRELEPNTARQQVFQTQASAANCAMLREDSMRVPAMADCLSCVCSSSQSMQDLLSSGLADLPSVRPLKERPMGTVLCSLCCLLTSVRSFRGVFRRRGLALMASNFCWSGCSIPIRRLPAVRRRHPVHGSAHLAAPRSDGR